MITQYGPDVNENQAAFGRLLKIVYEREKNFRRSIWNHGSEEDFEDCFQEYVMRLWQGFSGFGEKINGAITIEEVPNLRLYTNAAFRNARKDFLARQDHYQRMDTIGGRRQARYSTNSDPVLETEAQEEKERIKSILKGAPSFLKGNERTVFCLVHEEDYTNHQVSEKLGISPGNVKSALYNAREKVRKRIRDVLAD